MLYVLYTIFFLSCIALIGTVLLQPGKTDAGALFTSNISSSAFGPRGTSTILARITIVAAAVFMVSAFMISMPALQGGVSVLQTVTETPVETAPANTEAAPGAANTNQEPAANVESGEATNSGAASNSTPAEESSPAANN